MKKIVVFVLLLASIIFVAKINAADKPELIKIMYFHGTTRCEGCIAIESNITRSVDALYSEERKNGKIIFESIDFLAEGNEKFTDAYQLETQTLIISKIVDGKEVRWVNLDKVWDYAASFPKMKKYIDKEVRKLIKS